MYDPAKYPPKVLKRNEEQWLGKMEDCHNKIMEVMIDMPADVSEHVKTEEQEFAKTATEKLNKLILDFNLKTMSLDVNAMAVLLPNENIAANDGHVRICILKGLSNPIPVSAEIFDIKTSARSPFLSAGSGSQRRYRHI